VAAPHDAVLLLAYGGPTRPEEVRPFLDNILRGRPIPKERIEEVVRHYEIVGGASPINRLTFQQAEGLRALLKNAGPDLPVHVGMRFWNPTIDDTLTRMRNEGSRRAVGLILAPHPSRASRQSYLDTVDAARARAGGAAPEIDFIEPFYEHPQFIEAVAARVRTARERIPAARRAETALVCTAHSIPAGMAAESGYVGTLEKTAALTARAAGFGAWTLAYQSRSGSPSEAWLEPDIGDALRALKAGGARDVVVAPIGFVSDHVEVLYDLDVAAREVAGQIGLGWERAGTAGDHPAFLQMMATLVRARVGAAS